MNNKDFNELISSFSGKIILEGMPELAYVFNKEGRMLMWNKNVELKLGYTNEELKLKYIEDFVDYPDRQRTIEAMQRIFEEKQEQTIEYNLVSKDGIIIPFLGSGSLAIRNGEEYFVGMAIDISKLKNTENKLKDVIVEINKLKNLLQAENVYLRKELDDGRDFENIIGKHKSLLHSLYRVEQVAEMNTTVLIKGETGTGKELFALAIHKRSNRSNKPFVKVHCAAFSDTLLESELFGHEKGAFDGAIQKQMGRFELADKGTIFLDEIDEFPIELQSKLVRVIEDGEFKRMGDSKITKVDVRIIIATNKNLEKKVEQNLFREDLFYRINVYPISIIPLRERLTDIPLLIEYFVDKYNRKTEKHIKRIADETTKLLQRYTWPGNVRELENIIERAVIVTKGDILKVDSFFNDKIERNVTLSLMENERKHIISTLNKTYWKVSGNAGAAQLLDINPETLRSKMRKLGIVRPV